VSVALLHPKILEPSRRQMPGPPAGYQLAKAVGAPTAVFAFRGVGTFFGTLLSVESLPLRGLMQTIC